MGAWTVLGIAPTEDLIAIKKAYAARLKRTRPEDDAAAYQALRDAYEWAQQHARRVAVPQPASQAPTPHAKAPLPEVDAPLAVPATAEPLGASDRQVPPPQGSPQEVAVAPDHIAPGELAHSTLRYLRSAGPQALMAGWPILRSELDKLPLSERAEACNWFAQLVIDTPDMPLAYAKALSGYFGWETDFRAAQWMGPQRAEALREQLVNLGQAPPVEESLRRHYFEIEYYGQLVSVLAKWRLYLFAILAPSRIARLWSELEPGQRYALGVPKPPLHTLADRAMEAGWFVRSLVVVALAVVLVSGGKASTLVWPLRLILAGAVVFLGMPLLRLVYQVFFSFKQMLHSLAGPRWPVPGQPMPRGAAWSRAHTLAALAFACMLAATLLCAAAEMKYWPVVFSGGASEQVLVVAVYGLVLIAAYLPVLPATPASAVFPAILLLCVLIARALPWFDGLSVTAVCAGATWFMACCLAHTVYGDVIESAWRWLQDRRRQLAQRKGPSTIRNMLFLSLGVLDATLAMPYRLMAMAAEQSPRFVAAVLLLSVVALPADYRAWQAPFTWFMALLVQWLCGLYLKNGILALVPDQRHSAWRGWRGLVTLTAWILWALACLTHGAWMDTGESEGSTLGLWILQFLLMVCLPWWLLAFVNKLTDKIWPEPVKPG